MGTKGDFYLGKGIEAEWLGSLSWDAYPLGLPPSVREATSVDGYRISVNTFLHLRPDAFLPEAGWPWPWETSHKTNYTYAFDEGLVWACAFGSNWWPLLTPEPDHTTLKRKAARLPDMSFLQKHPEKFVVPPVVRGRRKKTT